MTAPGDRDAMGDTVAAFIQSNAQASDAGPDREVDAAALNAPASIATSPQSAVVGANDRSFREGLLQASARYRQSGVARTRPTGAPVPPTQSRRHAERSSAHHRGDVESPVEFPAHDPTPTLPSGEPRVFGWITGDERAVLEAHRLGLP